MFYKDFFQYPRDILRDILREMMQLVHGLSQQTHASRPNGSFVETQSMGTAFRLR